MEKILNDLIWEPAGAGLAYWRRAPGTGRVSAYCCLYATARDWIRVGRYLMENGTPDAPFLPDALWRDWLIPDLPENVRAKGAYGWHLRHDVLSRPGEAVQGPFAYFMGHNGQVLYLLPEQNMVIVRFGARPQLLHSTVYDIMRPDPN